MTEERKEEIRVEAKRRLDLWLENSTFEKMSFYGSYIKFQIALGLYSGYPDESLEEWMNKKDFGVGFITVEELFSDEYNNMLKNELFLPLLQDWDDTRV